MHGRLGDLRQKSRPEERSLPVALGPCSGLGSRFTVSELGSDIADCHSTQLMVDPTLHLAYPAMGQFQGPRSAWRLADWHLRATQRIGTQRENGLRRFERCNPNMVGGQKTVEFVEGQKGDISKFCNYEKCQNKQFGTRPNWVYQQVNWH